MSHSLSLRQNALAEIENARQSYALVEHGETFLAELEAIRETEVRDRQRAQPRWARRLTNHWTVSAMPSAIWWVGA